METLVNNAVNTKAENLSRTIQSFGTGTGTTIFACLCPSGSVTASSFLTEVGSRVFTMQLRGF
jgi:hypothetical protein